MPAKPLDALAQQIVAETACREWPLDALYECCGAPQPYRDLTLREFEQVVQMLADGYSTRRGRRGAYLHYDAVNRVLRARRGARLAAVTNAGVIPDQFDYDVVLLPEEHRVGTLNEDFAFESLPGRHLPARQHVVPHRQGRDRQGAGRRRARAAADDAVLAGREPGPHRRAVRGGVAAVRDGRQRCSTKA